ncbi:unnamed protein product [Withania somnifera]
MIVNLKFFGAERSEKVYLTISLHDAKDVSLKCNPAGFFNFSAVGVNGDSFSFTLQLIVNVSPERCKTNIGLRNILCSIQKEQKADSDDDGVAYAGEDDESSDNGGMLYLPDLEKARGN